MSKIGRFGEFGGQYIPETVMTAVHELEKLTINTKTILSSTKSFRSFTTIMQADRQCFIMQKR